MGFLEPNVQKMRGLGEAGDARALESLIQLLKDKDDAIGEAANKASSKVSTID